MARLEKVVKLNRLTVHAEKRAEKQLSRLCPIFLFFLKAGVFQRVKVELMLGEPQ